MRISKRALIVFDNKFPFVHLLLGREIFEHAFTEASGDTRRRAKSSVEELAQEYADAESRNDRAACVIIEHILDTRLLRIQTNVTLIATAITACATLVAAVLGFFLGVGQRCP